MSSKIRTLDEQLAEMRDHAIAQCYLHDAEAHSLGQAKAFVELRVRGADITVISNRGASNAVLLTKRVTLSTLASVFQPSAAVNSGTLPPNTVFWGMDIGTHQIGVYKPPARYKLAWGGRDFDLPMPGLLFCGFGRTASLYALKGDEFPVDDSELFYPPLPNIFGGGNVCSGQNSWGEIRPDTITAVWNELIASEFTGHLISGRSVSHPSSIYDLWNEIDGADSFPENELVAARKTVGGIQR